MAVVAGVDFLIAVNDTVFRVLLSGGGGADTFKLTFDGQTTANIVETDTPAQLQTKLEALSNIDSGDVSVSGSAGDYLIQFTGEYAGLAVPEITSSAETGALVVEINWQRYNFAVNDTLTPGATFLTPVGNALAIDSTNNLLCGVSTDADELITVDISDPASLAVLDNASSANMTDPKAVAIDSSKAYVTGEASDKLIIFDVSSPSSISELGSFTNANMNGPRAVIIDGNTAFVVNSVANTLQSLNVTNPAAVAELDSIGTDLNGALSATKVGDYIYVANFSDSKLIVFDVSNTSSISHVKTVTVAAPAGNIEASDGGCLFLSYNSIDRIDAYDITDREDPKLVGSLTHSELDDPQGMILKQNILYLSNDDTTALIAIDVSAPSDLRIIGKVALSAVGGRSPVGLHLGHLFVASRTANTIESVDVSKLQTARSVIGCQRGGQLSLDIANADATNKDSNNWAKSEQIIRSWTITFDSLSPEDDAGITALQRAYDNNYQLFVVVSTPSNKFYSGVATFGNLTREGPHDGLYSFSGSVTGSGGLTPNVAPAGLITGDDSDFDTAGNWTGTNATLTGGYDSGVAGHDKTLRIEADTGATNYAKLSVTLVQGQRYKLTLDYKHINTTGFVNNYSTVEVETHGTLTGGLPVKTSGFAEDFVIKFTSTTSGSKELRIYATDGANGDAANELIIDNITLQPV
jgi:hypothetical protein